MLIIQGRDHLVCVCVDIEVCENTGSAVEVSPFPSTYTT
jgi:hypothetical protein